MCTICLARRLLNAIELRRVELVQNTCCTFTAIVCTLAVTRDQTTINLYDIFFIDIAIFLYFIFFPAQKLQQ